jgi:peptidoglycan/LPS O-acetylase OafA/YrhL
VLLFKNLPSKRAAIVTLIGIYLIAIALFAWFAMNKYPFTHAVYWLLRIGCEFTAGVLLFKIWRHRSSIGFSKGTKYFLIPLVTLVMLLISHIPITFVLIVPFIFVTVYMIACDDYFANRLLARPWITYGGRLSYSLYMVHGLTLVVFQKDMAGGNILAATPDIKALYILAYVSLTVALTFVFYHWVEEPARKVLLATPSARALSS